MIWIRFLTLVLALLTAAPAVAFPSSAPSTTERANDDPNSVDHPVLAWPSEPGIVAMPQRVSASYADLPLHFEANRGQTDTRVKFLSRGSGHTLFLTPTEAVLVLTKVEPADTRARAPKRSSDERGKVMRSALRTSFVGANREPRVEGQQELPGKANYFIGADPAKWRTDVPTYAQVRYRNLYRGIDLVYYGNQRQLAYDFVVAPRANPKVITLAFQGSDKVEVDAQGDLVLHTPVGMLRHRRPVIYQEIDGIRREIAGGYVLKGRRRVGFHVAAYDVRQPLVIDPTLFYSTYLGGASQERGFGIAVDSAGSAYVTGFAEAGFPTTAGSFQTSPRGGFDAFVTKLNATGSALVYSTYVGGSRFDLGAGIAVDAGGSAYISGRTDSNDFPTTPGAFQSSFGGSSDAFVVKLNPSGSALMYSTYLGGSSFDQGLGIAIDLAGNAHVTGQTLSPGFPTTPGAFQGVPGGGSDAFLTKFDPSGSALLYSTYLGGSNFDRASGITVDTAGNAYAVGETQSTNFPTTPGAFQTAPAGGQDAFATKLNPTGSALVYSTYIGGSGSDVASSIAIDAATNAYVAGLTGSTNFPTTPGAVQTTAAGSFDAFALKLDLAGSGLLYSTYLGGSGNDSASGVAVDLAGHAHVTGFTQSLNFPTTPGGVQPGFGGGGDAFVTKLDLLGAGLVYSTYLGGSRQDEGASIALDSLPTPNAYVTGFTISADFPTTAGAFQTTFAGIEDAFVAKITDVMLPPPPTAGKVTGGGSIDVPGGAGSFGFIVQRQTVDASIRGQLQYVNHATGDKVHSVAFDSFAIVGNTATFHGICTNNGMPCSFTVNVTDNDEPGFTDTFTIAVDLGPADGGTLRSGNIQIHQ